MTEKKQTAIWWIRRDLRLEDNQALAAAMAEGRAVIPLFIIDTVLQASPYIGEKRLAFLYAGLRQLDAALKERGSGLVVREGEPLAVLKAVIEESGATAIYAEADHSPYARKRDGVVQKDLPLELTEGVVAHPPGAVMKEDGDPYIVFTPFSKVWKSLPSPGKAALIKAPDEINTPDGLESLPVPDEPRMADEAMFKAGMAEARKRLEEFVKGEDAPVYAYGKNRNMVDMDGTSKLSPYLRFGMISARQAVTAAQWAVGKASTKDGRKGAETWLNELIWREFYIHILYHFPQVIGSNFREKYDDIPWENNDDDFEAWCQGKTGYPIVDAAMRQLKHDGWMPNRARMIVASFLVKDLLIDWRWGEKWFMQHLVDGDPAANNGGWQWTAGTGTDAAPYFRIFNPILQGKKFDPDGRYVRTWIPELENVPDKYVQAPWEMEEDTQTEAGCIIGQDYPYPVIDHSFARERTLAAFDVS